MQLKLPQLLAHQREMLENEARFKVCCWGRRAGKTISCLDACLLGHGKNRMRRGALDGGIIWWVVPKIDDAALAYRHSLKAMEALIDVGMVKAFKAKRLFEFKNGGMLWIRSADDPQGLRGEGLDGVVFDEARNISREAWTDSIRPALSDKLGWSIFISTPNGRDWFWRLYEDAGADSYWFRSHLPTWANPKIQQLEIEQAKRDLGDILFRQEYGAEFVVAEGLFWEPTLFDQVFDWSDRVDTHPSGWPKRMEYTIQVVDTAYGKSGSDYQAICNLGTNGDGHMYIEGGLGRDGLTAFAGKIVRMAQGLPTWPVWTHIEEFSFQDGRAAVKDEARKQAERGRRPLNLETISPSEHNLEYRPPGGGLKDIRIIQLDPLVRAGIFRFVDTPETRQGVDQMIQYRIGTNGYVDFPDALARGVDSMSMLAFQLDEQGAW